jgi:hypothetical protein
MQIGRLSIPSAKSQNPMQTQQFTTIPPSESCVRQGRRITAEISTVCLELHLILVIATGRFMGSPLTIAGRHRKKRTANFAAARHRWRSHPHYYRNLIPSIQQGR